MIGKQLWHWIAYREIRTRTAQIRRLERVAIVRSGMRALAATVDGRPLHPDFVVRLCGELETVARELEAGE